MTSQVLLRLLWLITDSHNQRKYSFWLHTGEKRCDLFPIPVYKSSEIHQQTLAQNPCMPTITKERLWECDPLSPWPLPSTNDKMLFLIRGSSKIRTAHRWSWWLVLFSKYNLSSFFSPYFYGLLSRKRKCSTVETLMGFAVWFSWQRPRCYTSLLFSFL